MLRKNLHIISLMFNLRRVGILFVIAKVNEWKIYIVFYLGI